MQNRSDSNKIWRQLCLDDDILLPSALAREASERAVPRATCGPEGLMRHSHREIMQRVEFPRPMASCLYANGTEE